MNLYGPPYAQRSISNDIFPRQSYKKQKQSLRHRVTSITEIQYALLQFDAEWKRSYLVEKPKYHIFARQFYSCDVEEFAIKTMERSGYSHITKKEVWNVFFSMIIIMYVRVFDFPTRRFRS